jgi:hypothetical protein
MLICVDCGQPVDERSRSERRLRKLKSALLLSLMGLVIGTLMFLASMKEVLTEDPDPGEAVEQLDEGGATAGFPSPEPVGPPRAAASPPKAP